MKVQRVEMFVVPMDAPNDVSRLQALADDGRVTPESLVAIVGKTDGTGFHDDWGRVFADVALRGWTAGFLGIGVEDVASRVTFVLSGGCPGVITPHVVAVTRSWEEADPAAGEADEKRLVVGIAGSEPILPEEVGRMGMIRKVAAAVHAAMADAGVSDVADVHLVMVKVPGLTVASIKDAESRGYTVVTRDLTFGPEGAGTYGNDGAALGVALALGEVPADSLHEAVVRRNWSSLRIGHAATRDYIDAEGVRDALRSAGLVFDALPSEDDLSRVVHVFAKSVTPGSDVIRGQKVTLLDDHNAYQIGKALGGMLVASVTGRTTNYVSGGERNSHQGPPDGNIVAAVIRTG